MSRLPKFSRRLWLVALGVTALSGCASGLSIDGNWRFEWTAMNGTSGGKSYSCAAVLAFTINQTDNTFAGPQFGTGHLKCTVDSVTTDNSVAGESLTGGTITGQTVDFTLGSILGNNPGTVAGNTMSGTATWSFSLKTGSVSLTGTWAASRI